MPAFSSSVCTDEGAIACNETENSKFDNLYFKKQLNDLDVAVTETLNLSGETEVDETESELNKNIIEK